jgi:hypothetical protein
MIATLRMNVSLMQYMRTEYDNLHSLIEASETRTSKGPRNKVEVKLRNGKQIEES